MRGLLVCVMMLAGCGGESRPEPETVGDACDIFVDAGCRRIGVCGTSPDYNYDDCFQAVKNACCTDAGICSQPWDSEQNDIYACADAYETFSCQSIIDGVLPAVCNMNR